MVGEIDPTLSFPFVRNFSFKIWKERIGKIQIDKRWKLSTCHCVTWSFFSKQKLKLKETNEISRNRCKAEFLVQLDGLVAHSEQVLFLASTNLPWTLDPALLRRFQQILNIDLPGIIFAIGIIITVWLGYILNSHLKGTLSYK